MGADRPSHEGTRSPSAGERHEASQLSDPGPWDICNGPDRDQGMGASNPIELGLERAREVLHVDRLVRTQEDVRTLERLPDLILDDLRISTEHGSESVRNGGRCP